MPYIQTKLQKYSYFRFLIQFIELPWCTHTMPGFVSYWEYKIWFHGPYGMVRRHICKEIIIRQDYVIHIETYPGNRILNRESPRGREWGSGWLHRSGDWTEFKWRRGLWHVNKEGGVRIAYVKTWGMKQDCVFWEIWSVKGDTHTHGGYLSKYRSIWEDNES